MDLGSVDLNLLHPLSILLEERNVTRAAARLHVSQSTLSASLARLRILFDDRLLERRGNHYELTPLGALLLERTYSAEHILQRVFAARAEFDPASTSREFSLVISDFGTAILGAPLARILSSEAPNARLRLSSVSTDMVAAAPEGLRHVDGVVLPHGFFTTNHLDLFEDEWVCLVSATSDRIGESLTIRDLAELPWVSTHNGPTDFSPAFTQIQILGVEPRVEVVTQNFLTLPHLIAGTDRVAMVQRSLGRDLEDSGMVRVIECPFDVATIREAFWWHPVHEFDPEARWFRSVVERAAATLVDGGRVMAPSPVG